MIVIFNPSFKRGHEMRPYCVQSTHPMSEHCLYWLVESHTASVLAARLKAVQVCLSARTHSLFVVIVFRCFSCYCCQVCLSIRAHTRLPMMTLSTVDERKISCFWCWLLSSPPYTLCTKDITSVLLSVRPCLVQMLYTIQIISRRTALQQMFFLSHNSITWG